VTGREAISSYSSSIPIGSSSGARIPPAFYPGFPGNYVGKLNGQRLEGTVTWTWIGHWTQQRRGTWYATFKEPGPKSDPPGHDSLPRPPETPRRQTPPLQLGGDGCDIAVRPYPREDIESRLVPAASGETASRVERADRLYAASDYAGARSLYRQAATAGAAQALRRIGKLYDYGYGVGRDLEEALRWYRKAAAAGDPVAMHSIRLMYYTGEGLAKNPDEAIRWFRRAADLGVPSAMHDLAAA
jgi:Sel1 repeat